MGRVSVKTLVTSLAVLTVLSACGDPLRDITRLSDVPASNPAIAVAPTLSTADHPQGGLFARLLNPAPNDPTNAAVEAALAETPTPPTEVATAAVDDQPATERGGLFGLFRGGAGQRPRTGPDAMDVEPGTVMPFGQIARVCGMGRSAMGTRVTQAAGFNLFDTIPNSTAPRPFYVTGFDDNCARTFTGAVVVAGDIETHEFVRYRPSNERIKYTETDNAYEALKASVCRVPRGVPCGERTERLNRDTQFITVYNFFGGTFSAVPTKWAQILVHDGEVLSISIKNGD